MTNPKWLEVAARRSGQHSWTLSYVFEKYRKYQGKSVEELAEYLGCSVEVLDWMSLCRRPDADRFAEHLGMITKRFTVDPYRLAAVVRRVEVLDALPTSEEAEELGEDAFLLAARDHTTDDETSS